MDLLTELKIIRTDSTDPEFRNLVLMLDQDLAHRDGAEHAFYAAYNKLDSIGHVVMAYSSKNPVGCGAIKKYRDQIIEIKRMFVLPEFPGAGDCRKGSRSS